MRKYLSLAGVFLLAAALSVVAELKVPALTGRVVDQTGRLSGSDKSRVEEAVRGFEAATGGQMAILIIPSLEDDALESFSMRVAEKWKLGYKGKDNGLLLLVAMKERKIRFEVGYGFEGNVNDARAGDIIRGMQSFFRSKRFADGLVYAVLQAQEMITGKVPSGMPPLPRSSQTRKKTGPGGMLVAFVIIMLLSNLFRFRRGRRGFVIYSGGFGSGGFGGGGFSGGGFSGGGGGFGGGGASGGW